MTTLRFDYDLAKAASNFRKHGVSFDEAITTFFDAYAISHVDLDHSSVGDERFLHLGRSAKLRLLLVVHNEEDGLIRLISARPATPAERAEYEEA